MRSIRLAAAALAALACLAALPAQAAWTLTDAERRAFLEYYAPILFKRSNEDEGRAGRDWLANYDFDRDYAFGDNKAEWLDTQAYVDAATARTSNPRFEAWQIRPTMYAAAIEYTDAGRKDLVLIYQVYNGINDSFMEHFTIHDFERVEIHVRGVTTARAPGTGETAAFAVLTSHKRNVLRAQGSPDFNFYKTSSGNHLLLWQAQWSENAFGFHGHQLAYVEDSSARIFYEMGQDVNAEVELVGSDRDKNVHYVFVPETSSQAVSAFGARRLDYYSAPSLASRRDTGDDIPWSQVERITYELQDLADVFPSSYTGANWQPHWTTDQREKVRILDAVPIPRGGSVPIGLRTFNSASKDTTAAATEANYLGRTWFWGTYEVRPECGTPCSDSATEFDELSYAGTRTDSRGRTRQQANGDPASAGAYWSQHDYFVHSGTIDLRDGYESGFWLTSGWHTPERGGFDGRWAQLFDDRPGDDLTIPLSLSMVYPTPVCRETATYGAKARGGKPPFTFTWRRSGTVVKAETGVTSSQLGVWAYTPHTVTLTDTAGTSRSASFSFTPTCGGPGGPVMP